MCGRFTNTDPGRILERFPQFYFREEFRPSYNVAPTQTIAGVMNAAPTEIVGFRWGLIPSWAKEARTGFNTINARAESVADSRMYRTALRRRRCLLFADGFYEWRHSKEKQPVHFHLRTREPFAFAGLYEFWISPAGEKIRSAAMIVTQANSVVSHVHDRMPVILPEADFDLWLGVDEMEPQVLQPLLVPYESPDFIATNVDPLVNKVKNNSPECLRSIGEIQPTLLTVGQ